MANWKRRLALGSLLLAACYAKSADEWATPDDRRAEALRLYRKMQAGQTPPNAVSYEIPFRAETPKPAARPAPKPTDWPASKPATQPTPVEAARWTNELQPVGLTLPAQDPAPQAPPKTAPQPAPKAAPRTTDEKSAPPQKQPPAPPKKNPGDLGDTPREFGNATIQLVPPDQIIIKGATPQEVESIARLLEQLDLVSGLAEADMQVVMLDHAESGQLAKLLSAIYTAKQAVRGGTTTGGQTSSTTPQGTIGFVPIAQPNAIVVVARKVDIPDIAKQIKELDVGTKAGEQFRVFGLKNANPTQIASKLTTFFGSRATTTGTAAPGAAAATNTDVNLRMKVEITADERTNSVMVYAGPTDMEQVAKLIELFDSGVNLARVDIRYIPLKNTAATDLASLLQQSVIARANAANGTTTTTGQQQPQFQQPGFNQQQTTGSTTGTSATVKSARLRMLKRKPDGSADDFMESGILEDMTISPDTRTNSVLITAPSDVMSLLVQLIAQIDAVPNPAAVLKVFELKNADASAMLTTLQQFFGTGTTGQGGFNQQGFNQGGFNQVGGQNQTGVQPRSFAAPGIDPALSLTPITMSVDTRTNSLLATGSPNDLLVLETLVLKLDNNNARERKNFVYRLNTMKAEDASTAIDDFLQSQAGGLTGAANALGGAAQTGLLTLQQQIAQDVVVVAELSTNQLIVSASPRYFDDVLRMIQTLDRRPPQVLIQCLIAEITLTDNEEFGVEFGLQSSSLFDRSVVTNNVLTPGINFNSVNPLGNSTVRSGEVGLQGLSNFSLGRGNSDGFGGLIFSASSENVSVLVRALHRQRRLDVLSRPQIAVLDARPAKLVIGQSIPVINNSTTSQLGTIQNTFEYRDVGIILEVSAAIGPDGVVVMQVAPQVSSLATGAGIPIAVDASGRVLGSAPIINQNAITTTIVAADGQTTVVGGLISRSRDQDVRKIPWIGDVPLVGHLFRTDIYSQTKRELIVILTPRIVYSDADVEAVKAEELRRMNLCMPDVFAVHGDPYDPGVPSFHGLDRMTEPAGMQIPEKSQLPRTATPPRPQYDNGNSMPNAPVVPNAVPNAAPNAAPMDCPPAAPNFAPQLPMQAPMQQPMQTPAGQISAPQVPAPQTRTQPPTAMTPPPARGLFGQRSTAANASNAPQKVVHVVDRRNEQRTTTPPVGAPAMAR